MKMTFKVSCAPVLKEWTCCCCTCSLRAATIALGWLKMISVVMYIFVYIALLVELQYVGPQTPEMFPISVDSDEMKNDLSDNTDVLSDNNIDLSPEFKKETGTGNSKDFMTGPNVRQAMISSLITGIGSLILYGLLLFGIHKKRPAFMLPYLVLQLAGLVILFAAVLIGGIIVTAVYVRLGLLILFIGSIAVGILAFLWVVFYSYYRQLEEEKTPQPPHEVVNYCYGQENDQVKLADALEQSPPSYAYASKMGQQMA